MTSSNQNYNSSRMNLFTNSIMNIHIHRRKKHITYLKAKDVYYETNKNFLHIFHQTTIFFLISTISCLTCSPHFRYWIGCRSVKIYISLMFWSTVFFSFFFFIFWVTTEIVLYIFLKSFISLYVKRV